VPPLPPCTQFGDFLSGKMLRKESSDPFERVKQQAAEAEAEAEAEVAAAPAPASAKL
jgi:hypothetical protein